MYFETDMYRIPLTALFASEVSNARVVKDWVAYEGVEHMKKRMDTLTRGEKGCSSVVYTCNGGTSRW